MYNYFKGEAGKDVAIEGMKSGLKSQKVRKSFALDCKKALFEVLDDEIMYKALNEKLLDYFQKNQ